MIYSPKQDNNKPRTLIISLRNINNYVFNSCLHEFEDIIFDVENAHLLSLPSINFLDRVRKKVLKDSTERISPKFGEYNPSWHKPISLEEEYEMCFIIADFPCNLAWLNLLDNWKIKCKRKICYLVEIWNDEVDLVKNHLKILSNFDYIFLGHSQIVDEVKKIVNRPCEYVAPGIDTIKFAPEFSNQNRAIDICSMGRRSQITHESLQKLSEKKDFFYHFDSLNSSNKIIANHRHHRTRNANILKNSRYFITHRAKINLPQLTKNQAEIGYRYFEGAASGTVMIGSTPNNDAFKHYFDWDKVVIPMKFDEPNTEAVIAELDRQPQLLNTISKNNARNSLLRHDWLYRWQQILDKVKLPPNAKALQREAELKKLADSIYGLQTLGVN